MRCFSVANFVRRSVSIVTTHYPMKELLYTIAIVICLSLPLSAAEPGRERHPEIHAAIHSLEKAKAYMEHAAHDFGGHRREAIEACDRGIQQFRIALEERH
jgi:hypothetical protein